MERRGSGLTALCRGLLKALNGVVGAGARKCFLLFIKVGKMCVFVFEMSLSSSAERGIKIDPTVMPWVAQSMLNKGGWFVDGPVLLDYLAIPCRTAPWKHVFDTITSSYLQRLLTAARTKYTSSSHMTFCCCPLHPLSQCSLSSSYTSLLSILWGKQAE